MMKWINKKRNKKGFTLVELVVVIAILGILAAIAVPKLSKSRENAAIAAHNANVRTIESSATMLIADGTDTLAETPDGTGLGDYIQSWPSVPKLLVGKKGIHDDGKATNGSTGSIPAQYTLKIENGVITITPPKLKSVEK